MVEMTDERLQEITQRLAIAERLKSVASDEPDWYLYDVKPLVVALRASREETTSLEQRVERLEKAWLTERSQVLWLDDMTQGRFSWSDVPDFDKARYRVQAERGLISTRGDNDV